MSYRINARVESYDVQPNGNIKISSLLKLFQKAAGDELLDTPFSFHNLAGIKIAFVLTKMNVKILRDIKIYDEIEIVTHPRSIRGASYPRDFIAKVNGEIAVTARSMWALLDLQKRCVLRPSSIAYLGEIPTSQDDSFELDDVRRIISADKLNTCVRRTVMYSNLDMNNHLNNTYYSDFIFDTIAKKEHLSDAGMYLQINYKTEARLDDELEIYFSDITSNECDVYATNNDGKVCFTAYVKR